MQDAISKRHVTNMYRYPVHFTPDAPPRIFPRMGIVSSGLAEFYAEMIRSAVQDSRDPRAFSGSSVQRVRQAAITWLYEEVGEWDCMSFNVACQAIGIDPAWLRNQLLTRVVSSDDLITQRTRTAGRYHKVGREE